ncbi:uncharacterized protein C8R40DRAFT_1174809 [Lentinula edodes]|uniref:uncharacterized protein n=1 Tax=Lentinula edodes TaxID=5353 RepID=UPI001E8DD74B|nr:uncharacterized protein C8R40DRAFT_1174809 [Lentinula edodes]KAH7871105.1 hypothetical protein C8R40DRAFT_1174809 [Lentinula edodes]
MPLSQVQDTYLRNTLSMTPSANYVLYLFRGVWVPSCKLEGQEKKKKLQGQRLVDMLNWEVQPVSCQHRHTMYYTSRHMNITFDTSPKHLPLAGAANVEQPALPKTSATTKNPQEKPSAPQPRTERPPPTPLEDHTGLGELDTRTITNAKPKYKQYHKFRRVEGWEDHLKWLAMPREGEEDAVKEDMLLTKFFTQWLRHGLGTLPAPTDAQEQVLSEDMHPCTIDLAISRLSPIKQACIYSPGHPQHEDHSTSYKDTADAR